MTDILTVRDLHIRFRLEAGELEAVRGVSFSIPEKSTVALVGESGSGKSVISQAILGILPDIADITDGSIVFRDPDKPGQPLDIATLDRDSKQIRDIRGGRISMIFQEPMSSLSPLHTVGDQITETVRLHRDVNAKVANDLAYEMLALVGFPDPGRALKTYPFELSGGLRQRAMIAMALVCRPALLIADEPTTALDVTIQAQILKQMRDLQSELGTSILMITHDLGVVANVADEVVVVYHGQVMERGPLGDIFEDPQHDYLKALLRAIPHFDMQPEERLTPIREIRTETGHLLDDYCALDAPGVKAGETLLDVRNVDKRFAIRKGGMFSSATSEIIALDDVSLHVRKGECLGLVGESGCGKTTLSKVIMCAIKPDSGQVLFNDGRGEVDLTTMTEKELFDYRRRIQFIFQDPYGSLNPRLPVSALIAEPLVIHGIGDRQYREEMVKELMRLVGLDVRHLNRYPHSFSGGQRQRIGIARALALKPDLLLCDEPVSALDVSVQAQVLNLLKDLQQKLGLTLLFVSHNLAVVDYIADRIAVMCAGRMVEMAPCTELFRRPVHPYTKALFKAVPFPDPRRPLDFDGLMDGKMSSPEDWPEPFAVRGNLQTRLLDLGNGHFVRANESLLKAGAA
jgi:peptide/nickel transport system ATP-binding protein